MLEERIRILREERGLSQKELGKCVGVSKQTVSNWENGSITPAMDKFLKLIEFFHTTPNYILGYEDHYMMDVDGLTEQERRHIQWIVTDFKENHNKSE